MTAKTLDYYLSLRYPILLIPDQEDGTWYARIPMLNGCMADGATPAEALAELETVRVLSFETSLQHGHSIPEPQPIDIHALEAGLNKNIEAA